VRSAVLLASAILLAGCAKASEAEVRQYEMMKRSHASRHELCKKARKVAEAYLAEENEAEYEMWNIKANLDCNEVLIESIRP